MDGMRYQWLCQTPAFKNLQATTQAILRALIALEHDDVVDASWAELEEYTGLSRATVARHFRVLQTRGWIGPTKSPPGGPVVYRLGLGRFRRGEEYDHFVYGIANPVGLIKIGIARNIRRRHEDLQKACGQPLHVAWVVPTQDKVEARSIEKELHRYFASHRTYGEWFNLTIQDDAHAVAQTLVTRS